MQWCNNGPRRPVQNQQSAPPTLGGGRPCAFPAIGGGKTGKGKAVLAKLTFYVIWCHTHTHTHTRLTALFPGLPG